MRTRMAVPIFVTLAVVQCFLYATFMQREVAWNYILHGDPTWYVYFNYKIYHAVVERTWNVVWQQAKSAPWGILLFLETLVPQFILGPSRFSVGVINLLYFLLAQAVVYGFFSRLTRSAIGGIVAVALLMAMQTPFRGDGPGLNIADFHFDLVLFYLLVLLHLLVAWSNCFARKWVSVAIGVVAGITVATRLVSFFLLDAVFGVFCLVLLYRWLRPGANDNGLSRARVLHLGIATGAYLFVSLIPIAIARSALYSHYFRFVFDEKFSADRAGLYVMGASSKLGEAYEVAVRMFCYDFGAGYLGVALVSILAFFVCGRSYLPQKNAEPPAPGWLRNMLADREAVQLYWVFLLVSMIVSYVMHIAFPIKSDHLTRMTAAPILIAVTLWISPICVGHMKASVAWRRVVAWFSVGSLVLVALVVQLAFYTGPGRRHEQKAEILAIQSLYADLSRILDERKQMEMSISVDRIVHFELGALLGFAIYDFENNDRMVVHHPKLGGVIDEPIAREHALQLLSESDVVLLGDLPYPKSQLPFMRSLEPIAEDVHRYVEQHFCFFREYELFGERRRLYVKHAAWKYSASAFTELKYGPEGLLEGRNQIWHAPWGKNQTQWVEFRRASPIRVSSFTIVAQDDAVTRAPRDFSLEAIDPTRGWVPVLSVRGADFSTSQSLTWPVAVGQAYSQYRLVVTKNNGDPNLMTIKSMDIDAAIDQKCGQP